MQQPQRQQRLQTITRITTQKQPQAAQVALTDSSETQVRAIVLALLCADDAPDLEVGLYRLQVGKQGEAGNSVVQRSPGKHCAVVVTSISGRQEVMLDVAQDSTVAYILAQLSPAVPGSKYHITFGREVTLFIFVCSTSTMYLIPTSQ